MVFNPFYQGRIALLMILFVSAIGLVALPAKAKANTYEVSGVKIDIVDQSSVNAREKAFSQAQSKAFDILATRFLSADELKTYKKPSVDVIARLVRDVSLISEKSSARRYVGEFKIRFKPAATKNHFGKAPLATNEDTDQPPQALVVPFFWQQGQWSLWDQTQNPLLKTLRTHTDKNFMIPAGDTLDQMDIKKDFIESYNRNIIKRIKARYDVEEIIILAALFDPLHSSQLKIDFYRTDTRKLTKTKTLEFNVTKEKTLGALVKTAMPTVIVELKGNWKGEPEPTTDFTTILNDTTQNNANKESYNPTTQEPEQGEVIKAQSGSATMVVQFASMNEWITLRRDIQQTPSVTGVKINNIKTFEAEIIVSYADWDSLLRNLSARGLSIRSLGNNKYLIMRAQ